MEIDMDKQFTISKFANKADLDKAKADYVAKNKATALAAGFNVIPALTSFQVITILLPMPK